MTSRGSPENNAQQSAPPNGETARIALPPFLRIIGTSRLLSVLKNDSRAIVERSRPRLQSILIPVGFTNTTSADMEKADMKTFTVQWAYQDRDRP